MRANATPSPIRNGKRHLLTSCAITAGMMALACGGPALAQVNGNAVFVDVGVGTSFSNSPGTNTTTVNVTQAQSIINWVPTDTAATGAPIDFLPAGENWNFIGTGQYTVLNRFTNGAGGSLSRQIALNGTVNSYVGATTGPRGGNIWFYNAGGILIGASGVINVGSLVLTANDIDTSGGLLDPSGTIRFRGPAGTSAITVNGAINANNVGNPGSSYVALVAPRVVQAGNVRVDGSAAYVAAEQADIRINGGLFDINVLVGAEGGNVITHTGNTTGPAHQDGDTDQNRIYMVAIPKNDAVTMLVSGAVGYDDAVSATEADGAIRLSAGYNVTNGELDATPVNATAANITAGDVLFRSSTSARARGAFVGQSTQSLPASPPPLSSAGQFFVEGDGTFIGDASATLAIGANQSGGALGSLTVQSGGANGVAGNAAINVTGGTLSAPGALTVRASGEVQTPTGDSQGGTASLTITGGSVTTSGVTVEANGIAAAGTNGNGTGGTATFTQTGGDANVGDMTISADGFGSVAPGQSGSGIGGITTIDLLGGTITAADIVASANGLGGQGSQGDDDDLSNVIPGGLGGTGQGGTATINIDGSAVVDASIIVANSAGIGGAGGDFVNASSFGGLPGTPGNGGAGNGGAAAVNVIGGTTTASSMIADASGIGGDGGNSFFSSSSGGATGVGVGGTGGTGQGGTATIALQTAIDAVGIANSIARGTGGNGGLHNVGGNGGDGFGGIAQAIVTNFEAGELAVTLDSTGVGGNGTDGRDGAGGNGGNGAGGTARMLADGPGASLTVVETNFTNGGTGGNGGAGGLGFGSFVAVAPSGGNGGNGQGGTIEVVANEGATVSLGLVSGDGVAFGSIGTGGNGGTGSDSNFGEGRQAGDGGTGGGGNGGSVRLATGGGTITSNGESVAINASGVSGTGGVGGAGQGGGTNGANGGFSGTAGGRVAIEALNGLSGPGQITLGNTSITANGDIAGRIELSAEGNLGFAGLDAEALGFANPTNNDTDGAPAGIFLAMNGGTIASQGDVSLTTDSSVGVYAQSNGIFDVDGILTVGAGDQIDIRHEFREGVAPTIRASDSLIATALNSISGAPGSLIGAGTTLSLATSGVTGTIGVDRLGGTDIMINSNGAASVEHAEAANDFTATAGSFRTGLNSIITGGDILIASPGAVDLGNSTAGGFVSVNGQSIVFNNINAGVTVDLNATGTAIGAEGIQGGSITAGNDINLGGNSIALTGAVNGGASLLATGSGGIVGINQANVDGNISIFAAGDLTGTYVAGGDVRLNSDANINASATANGGFVDSRGGTAEGNVFVDAAGNVVLAGSAAARMFGVNAGGSVTITNATAGEDFLVLAGTTASLTNIGAGDDADIRAGGDLAANNVRATGAGADTHFLSYLPGSGFTIALGEGVSSFDGSDVLLSAGGSIDASALSAGDDIAAIASGTIGIAGAETLGLGVTAGGSNIRTQGGDTVLAGLDSFNDVLVDSTGRVDVTGAVEAGRDVAINANDVSLAALAAPGGNALQTIGATGNVTINSANAIGGGRVLGQGNVILTAGTTIDMLGVVGGTVNLDGATGIAVEAIQSVGTTTLNSDDGTILAGSLVSNGEIDARANSIRIDNGGDMIFTNLITDVGDAMVRAGGELFVTNGSVAGTADLRSDGERLGIGTLTAANATLAANGGFMTLGNVTVTNTLGASARTSLFIDGVVTGRNISLASADISIGTAARVGTAGTTQGLSIANNDSDNQTFIGGTGTRSGYHIDAAELTRVFGTDVRILAPEVAAAGGGSVGSAAPPDVVVDAFTFTGGAAGSNLGANGSLTIETPGKMRVIGNVQLTGLADTNALGLFAGEALEVILGQGTVRLTGAGNAPGGQLNMASDDIIVATMDAIADIGAATTTAAMNTRLGENDGVLLDEGALFARGIRADVAGGFYVQNSGAGTDFAQRRGLTFGAGGLDVRTEGPSRIVINGVQLGPNGQVTGLDTIPLLTIAGAAPAAGSFDPRSTFNGCIIANPGACVVVTFENSFPVQDVIEEEADAEGDDGDGNSLPIPLITMRGLDPLSGEPLLDDPVTGAGNDDLWTTPGD